jgi:hypothetical protein
MRSLIVGILLFTIASVAAQAPTRVLGRVLDAQTNEPLAGAQIGLVPDQPATVTNPLIPPLQTQTNSSGTFALDAYPGRFRVQVQRQGFVSAIVNGGSAPPLVVDSSGGTVNLGDIRLARGGVIEGRILDEKGRPLPGVSVTAVRPAAAPSNLALPVGAAAQTNDLGEYRLSGVPTGRYYILARPTMRVPLGGEQSRPGLTFSNTFYPGFADIAVASLVDVTAGNTTNGIAFQMLQTATFSVTGIVVDRDERPIPGAIVSLQAQQGVPGPPMMILTLSNGTFSIAVPDGVYLAAASVPVVVSTATSRSAAVRVSTGGPGSVRVTVEGRPVSGVRIVAERP